MQESHFLGFVLVQQKVDGLAFVAEFTLRVSNLRTDIRSALIYARFRTCFVTLARMVNSGSVVGTALRNFT